MIGKGRVIESDLFDIAKRLKEIDASYFVFYRYKTKRYEVHSTRQRGNSLCFVVPYEKLDGRVLSYALRSRIERVEEFLLETERENEKIRQAEILKAREKAEKRIDDVRRKL